MSQTPVWFITAASSGFGKYMALEALSRGHKVIASARNTSRISDLADAGAVTTTLDVTWPLEAIEKVAKEANDQYGYINHLVNAAGYILVGAVEETSAKEDFDHFNTNVLGLLNTSKAFLPYLRANKDQHRTVTNFGSIGSWVGGAGYALYCGTKFAVSGISEGMAAELAPLGIKVTVIEPGYFRTGFLNPDAKVVAEKQIEAYDGTSGPVRKRLEQTDNRQPGDVAKGAKVIVDVLTQTGVAEGREIPVRVVLGADAPPVVRGKLERTEKLLREWEGVTTRTNHE